MGYNQNNAGMHYIRFNSEASKAADEFEWDNHCANRKKAVDKPNDDTPVIRVYSEKITKREKAIQALKKQNIEVDDESVELQMMFDEDYRAGINSKYHTHKKPLVKNQALIVVTKPAHSRVDKKPEPKPIKPLTKDTEKSKGGSKEKNSATKKAQKQAGVKSDKRVAKTTPNNGMSPGALGNDPRFKELFAELLKGYQE